MQDNVIPFRPKVDAGEFNPTDEVELEDLAFIAKRIMVRLLSEIDWAQAGDLAAVLVDESDVAVVKQFIAQASVNVYMPFLDDEDEG